ncbi:hypothetical protein GCM10010109_61800 [Actinoplanes campanulatus]|nr:hypothetical protein GCM10010109_61800 [Actinoplanes campanulatus]GID42003.1 hypothetical protein Aca09nite_85090 [Actinoplanes campanulatus]
MGLPQELEEFGCGRAGLAGDRGERSAFDCGVLGNHCDSTAWMLVDGMAAFGADMDEPRPSKGIYHLAEREIGQSRAHATEAIWNAVTNGVASICG